MKRISLQWRLTLFTALLIAAVCISLNFLLYRNGVYYIDSLQSTVIDYNGSGENIYIDIPALDAGFWGRYYINGEYVKVEENKIVWRGRTFYKNTSKESLKYIQFMESEPQMSRAEVRSRYLYNVNPNVSNKRK